MAVTPKQVADSTNKILNAWSTLAPAASFGGMTLAQYQAAVKPSFDTRTQLDALEAQVTSTQDARDNADNATIIANQKVVNGVKGDPAHGEDSDLYDAMGYVRKSARKTGLTRKGNAAPDAAKK
jgi:hypothetical protein